MIFCRHKFGVLVLTTVFILKSIVVTEALSALKGTTVQLKCIYRGNAGLSQRLQWRKDTTILSEDTTIANTHMKGRLNITGDHSLGEYHLNISKIIESDTGPYTCSISKTGKLETQQLIVIVGPTAIAIENVIADNKISGIEGQYMTIKCTAQEGHPQPDVKLEILGTVYTNKQSVQQTFNPTSSYDGSNVTCQAGYEDINYYSLSTFAYIFLQLKPIVTPLTPDILIINEAKLFSVSCQSTGSRPAASMFWLLGPDRRNVTSNSTSQSNQGSSTNKFTVTSMLEYSVDRRYNGKKLICDAVNLAGHDESFLKLNVTYAPDVRVENKTFSQTQSSRQIPSIIDGNPPVNKCTWRHKSTYGEIIRNFSNNNQILTLPAVHEDKRYQDTGEYVCSAENGITGINGQQKQKGSGYVISNDPPVITSDNKDNSTQYGKFGESTKVYVNVYSIPKYFRMNWYIGNTQLGSNKYAIKEDPAIVKDMFHGVEVQLDGYRITLTISNLQEVDFTNYTLRLYYSSQFVQHEVTLASESAPETPSNFSIISSGETSVTFQWIPGYNGGQTQTFHIEYRISGIDIWLSREIKTSSKLDLHNVYTLSGLQDKTTYELRMYAKNSFNHSQHTEIETITTLIQEKSTALGGVIGGVAGGLVAVIVILVIIAIVLFKRKKDSGFPSKRTRSKSDSEVQEGLKDNILYDGSEPDGLKVNELYQSAGPDSINTGPNSEYAEVSKPHKKPSKSTKDEYSEVQKQNDMYAEVDKKTQQKNVKSKMQKDKKKPPKSGKTKGKALNNNLDGEYANSGIPMKNMACGAYSNAEDQSAKNKQNDQGLEYADLTFGSQIPKGKQPVIHGDENRTIYSDVDHTKKAPPPPQESEYEETNIRHGKK